jgi:hypothetical protein
MHRRNKTHKHCEGCRQDEGARFRTLFDLYLCDRCYAQARASGKIPGPQFSDDDDKEWEVASG